MKKIVLGFSGGLDTSYCATFLSEIPDTEVHSIVVNTGGFTANELLKIETHAYALGVKTHTAVDATRSYYERIIKFLVFGNVLKNNSYPLSVSAERLSQAMHIADHVKQLNADAVAHGSTGAGNDQVRFDMIFNVLIPGIEIITPIRDMKLSREEEVTYLKSKGVSMDFEKSTYSINKGLWGTSVGGKETLSSGQMLPESAWPTQVTKQKDEELKLGFLNGEINSINDLHFYHPVEAIQYLNNIVAPFGIGRDIHVGDTIIGIKGRVGFEAAAPTLIIKSHHALEKHVLSKWQLMQKDSIAQLYGNFLHEGQILDPVMRDMEAYFISSQKKVTGSVYISLFPYRFIINGIESTNDLMNNLFGCYGEMNYAWSGTVVRGFTKIFGNQSSIYYQTEQANQHEN